MLHGQGEGSLCCTVREKDRYVANECMAVFSQAKTVHEL